MTPAGWYPDPAGTPGMDRYWDGQQWTDHLQQSAPPAPPQPPEPVYAPPAQPVHDPFAGQHAQPTYDAFGQQVPAEPQFPDHFGQQGPQAPSFGGSDPFNPAGGQYLPGGDNGGGGRKLPSLSGKLPSFGGGGLIEKITGLPLVAKIVAGVVVLALIVGVGSMVTAGDPAEVRSIASGIVDATKLSDDNARCIARTVWSEGDQDELKKMLDDGTVKFLGNEATSAKTDIAYLTGAQDCLDDADLVKASGENPGADALITMFDQSTADCFIAKYLRMTDPADLVAAAADGTKVVALLPGPFDACKLTLTPVFVSSGIADPLATCLNDKLAAKFGSPGKAVGVLNGDAAAQAAITEATTACQAAPPAA